MLGAVAQQQGILSQADWRWDFSHAASTSDSWKGTQTFKKISELPLRWSPTWLSPSPPPSPPSPPPSPSLCPCPCPSPPPPLPPPPPPPPSPSPSPSLCLCPCPSPLPILLRKNKEMVLPGRKWSPFWEKQFSWCKLSISYQNKTIKSQFCTRHTKGSPFAHSRVSFTSSLYSL
jgi:hypothetical protein